MNELAVRKIIEMHLCINKHNKGIDLAYDINFQNSVAGLIVKDQPILDKRYGVYLVAWVISSELFNIGNASTYTYLTSDKDIGYKKLAKDFAKQLIIMYNSGILTSKFNSIEEMRPYESIIIKHGKGRVNTLLSCYRSSLINCSHLEDVISDWKDSGKELPSYYSISDNEECSSNVFDMDLSNIDFNMFSSSDSDTTPF